MIKFKQLGNIMKQLKGNKYSDAFFDIFRYNMYNGNGRNNWKVDI